jgi:hypothetical protein
MTDSIEASLEYMGVRRGKGRDVGYTHWLDFFQIMKKHSGDSEHRIIGLARSYVGIDERYLKQFIHACLEWGTVRESNGHLFYVGLPKGVKVAKGKPFPPYGPPPETKS